MKAERMTFGVQALTCGLTPQIDDLGNSTEAALAGIAAAFAAVSDCYARDYDSHLTKQNPGPFQIPGESRPMPAHPRYLCHYG